MARLRARPAGGAARPAVEVFCALDPAVRAARFDARSAGRGAGYLDRERDATERWNHEVGTPVAAGRAVLEVDTGGPVDVVALARRVRATAAPGR